MLLRQTSFNEIKKIIYNGFDINYNIESKSFDQNNYTFLESSIVLNHDLDNIKWLINNGAKISRPFEEYNETDTSSYTINGSKISESYIMRENVLILAMENKFEESDTLIKLLTFLLHNGADIDRYHPYYRVTPVQMAIKRGFINVIKLLVKNGAYIDKYDILEKKYYDTDIKYKGYQKYINGLEISNYIKNILDFKLKMINDIENILFEDAMMIVNDYFDGRKSFDYSTRDLDSVGNGFCEKFF